MTSWRITALVDRERAGGTFQIISLEDDDGSDLTELVDKGTHFHDKDELKEAIVRGFANRLKVEIEED
jgi:hypothetical protein